MRISSCVRAAASVAIAGALTLAGSIANAQSSFPSRPVTIVVPVGAGGWADNNARLIAQKMAGSLGQTVIVENRPSAGSITGTLFVAKSPADGYTLLAISDTFAIAPAINKSVGYDPLGDFIGVGQMIRSPIVLVTGANSKLRTVADIVKEAKRSPGAFPYASGGSGSTSHLAVEAFLSEAGIKLLHVPYKGNAPAIPDLIAGRVNFIASPISSVIGLIRAGQLRPIAFTSAKRSQLLPNVPTLRESGYPNLDISVFSALMVPRRTPTEVVAKLRSALDAAKQDPAVIEKVQASGDEVVESQTPEQFATFLGKEVARYQRLVADKGIKAD
jgi:tripartite-type tricarboxylate transporter receptor subunit TctC